MQIHSRSSDHISLRHSWLVWSIAASFYCYQFMLRVAPSVMTSELMQSFQVDACALGILTSFYFYAYAFLQVPIGIMLDRIGLQKLLTCAALLCGCGAFLFALSHNVSMASLGRFIIGSGSAVAFLSCMKVGTVWFPPKKLSRVIGMTLLLGTFGAMCGTLPLSILIDHLGWRYAMGVIAFFGIILAILLWNFVQDNTPPKLRTYIESHHITSAIPLNIKEAIQLVLKKPQTWILAIYGFLMYAPLAGFADMWGVPFLIQVHNMDKSAAALATSALYLGIGMGTPCAAFISDYLQSYKSLLWISALGTLVPLAAIFYLPLSSPVIIITLLFIAGIMLGGQFIAYTIVCDINPISVSGTATGFQNMICLTSGIIFQPAIGWFLDFFWHGQKVNGICVYLPHHYQMAISIVSLCLFLAFCLSFWVKDTYSNN